MDNPEYIENDLVFGLGIDMSDSKMFTKNKMPEGYSDVWKAFAKHWLKKD